jgi:homocysteine S-methyltransferase
MTQILFDVEPYEEFRERLGGKWPIPVLLGIFPLTSYRLALRLHNEVPGITVPEPLQRDLERAGADAPQVGFAHARDLIGRVRGHAEGVYLVAPFRQPLRVLELLG